MQAVIFATKFSNLQSAVLHSIPQCTVVLVLLLIHGVAGAPHGLVSTFLFCGQGL